MARETAHTHLEEPEWVPELQRVALVLDIDVTALTITPDAWALAQLRTLSNRLNRIGITALPVRIEVEGWTRLP